MKAQERGCLERNRHFMEPARFDPKRTESGNESIPNEQIRCTPTGAVKDQRLMLGKNGFGYDCSETSGLSKANNGCDEMDDENEQFAHNSSYSGPKIPLFLR
jgi:hypothetical protein